MKYFSREPDLARPEYSIFHGANKSKKETKDESTSRGKIDDIYEDGIPLFPSSDESEIDQLYKDFDLMKQKTQGKVYILPDGRKFIYDNNGNMRDLQGGIIK